MCVRVKEVCRSLQSTSQDGKGRPLWGDSTAVLSKSFLSSPYTQCILSSPIRTTYNCCIAQDQFRPNSEQNAASTESNRPEDVDYEDVDEYDDDDDKKKEARVERTTTNSSSSSKKK